MGFYDNSRIFNLISIEKINIVGGIPWNIVCLLTSPTSLYTFSSISIYTDALVASARSVLAILAWGAWSSWYISMSCDPLFFPDTC